MPLNVALKVEYVGTGFHGFQKQPAEQTIQGELERALALVIGTKPATKGAGRTDAGVHAVCQVVNFSTDSEVDLVELPRSLNGILDPRIRVTQAAEAPHDFHARRAAVSKEYRYVIINRPAASPFHADLAAWEPRPLDVQAMDTAGQCFIGTHDFSAFAIHSSDKPDRVRTITRLAVGYDEKWPAPTIAMKIVAESFLHRMVRMIAGTLMRAGLGHITAHEAGRILAEGDKNAAGPAAPAQGLYLAGIDYGAADPFA